MTTSILWCGQEDLDFPNGNIPTIDATAGRFAANYARYSLRSVQGAIGKSVLFTPATAGWLSCYFWAGSNGSAVTGYTGLIGFCDSETSKALMITLHAATSGSPLKLSLCTFNGATFTLLKGENSGGSLVLNSLNRLDVSLVSFGANATINVYLNGSLVPLITYTGDVTQSSTMTDFDCIGIGPNTEYYADRCYSNVSEVIFANGDTRSFRLATLYPNGAGDGSAGWTGAYTDIDETTLSDADNVYSDTADSDFQCNMSATPTTSSGVLAIGISARAAKSSDASIQTLELGVKSAGSIDVDAGHVCSDKWQTFNRIAATINGSKLTTALCDSIQLDLQSET